MALGDAYQDSTDTALRVLASRPPEPEQPARKQSAWSVVPRAVTAGSVEAGAGLFDVIGAYGQTMAATGANRNPLVPESQADAKERREAYDKLKTEGIDWRMPESQVAYAFARDLRPDPLTAGTAENIVFGVTKGLTKAIGSAAVLGPAGGAAAFGGSEGLTTAEDLAVQGVDKETRTKVGTVTAGVNAAGMLLPIAGQTWRQTLGLAAVGGPGSFVAQQQATRQILENADYGEIAQQFDPLDPVGLTVATLLPLGFAGAVKYRSARATRAPQEQVDAAMTQNLTASRDAYESRPPVEPVAYPPDVPRAADLPLVERQVEARFADRIVKDYKGAVEQYNAEPDSMGGKVLNVDTARELSPDYAASRESRSGLSSAVHEPASYFIKRLYADRLAEMPPDSTVMFTSGGTGAGKTSAIAAIDSVRADMDRAFLVYDTNMNGLSSAVQKIEQALEAGGKVQIVHVQRDPVDALVSGALPRAARIGRAVPLSAHEATHVGSAKTIGELAKKYANDPRVSIRVLDNTKGRGGAVEAPVEFVKGFNYNKLRERLVSALEKEYQSGRISEAIYRGTLGADPAAAGLVRSAGSPRVSEGLSRGQRGGYSNADRSRGEAGLSRPDPGASQAGNGSSVTGPQDPHIQSVLDRIDTLKSETPDMPVAVREDGTRATAADEIEAIRAEAREGTETDLGADDAPLLKVAAECLLSKGPG